jgi:hypothetical protein
MEVWTDGAGHHLPDPWPRGSPLHGAAKDGVPILVKLGRRELRVLRVVSTYEAHKTGERFIGTACKLQLDDYRAHRGRP